EASCSDSVSCSDFDAAACGTLVMPCEMKFTTSSRVTPFWCRKYTACESFSPKIATSTFAPVTSLRPEDCTWSIARWITRWKPSVGWVSTSSPDRMGVCSVTNSVRSFLSSSMSAAHARRTSEADGLSSNASRRCSTVMNSWRFCRASMKAMWRLTSSSCAIMSHFFHYALQRMLVLLGVRLYLFHLGRRNILRIHPAHPDAFPVHFEHDLRRFLPAQREEFLQHHDDEIHRSIVVVQQQHLEHGWLLDPGFLRFQYCFVTLPGRHARKCS